MVLVCHSITAHCVFTFRRCKSYEFNCPHKLAVSCDGRVYVGEYSSDTLGVIEADGSQSEITLCPEPKEDYSSDDDSSVMEVECIEPCSDGGVVVFDDRHILRKYSKNGEFVWQIKLPYIREFYLDSNDLIHCRTGNQVNVYSTNGVFSHVECAKDTKDSSISAHSSNQEIKPEPIDCDHPELTDVTAIAVSNGDPELVVATGYEATKLFVFDSVGSFLYSVKGVCSVCDMTFGPDNSLWIAEWEAHHFGEVIRIPELFQLPPPLSYLCELSILPHLNELPVSRLPPRLAGLFEKWTKLVTVAVKYSSFTDDRSKSRSILETFKLKVKPNVSNDMILWLVCRRMNLKYSEFDIASHRKFSLKRWEPVSFPSECENVDFFVYHDEHSGDEQ